MQIARKGTHTCLLTCNGGVMQAGVKSGSQGDGGGHQGEGSGLKAGCLSVCGASAEGIRSSLKKAG